MSDIFARNLSLLSTAAFLAQSTMACIAQESVSEPVSSYETQDKIDAPLVPILVMTAAAGAVCFGVAALFRRLTGRQRYSQPPDAQGLRIRRVESFREMDRFLALRLGDADEPDRIKIRSLRTTTAHRAVHVMATRGPGIEMTSTLEVAAYHVHLRMKDTDFHETLPESCGSEIKKLHLGAAAVCQSTQSAQETARWLQREIQKLRNQETLPTINNDRIH